MRHDSWRWWRRLGSLAVFLMLVCDPKFVTTSPLPLRITIIVDRTASMTRTDVTQTEVNDILESVTAAVKKLPSKNLPTTSSTHSRTPSPIPSPTHSPNNPPEKFPPYEVRTVFLDTSSSIGDVVLREVTDNAAYTTAVILLTDGVVTAGTSLSVAAAAAKRNNIPVSVIACETENTIFDVQIQSRHHILHTFRGGTVPVEAVIIGENVPPEVSHFAVTLKNVVTEELLESWEVPVVSEMEFSENETTVSPILTSTSRGRPTSYHHTIRTNVVSANTGVSHYRLSVSPVPTQSEWCSDNNHDVFSVVTHDQPLRVLQLEDLPRMEFRYLYDFLSREPGIELTTLLADADSQWMEETPGMVSPEKLDKWVKHDSQKLSELFDIVICGPIAPSKLGAAVLDSLHEFAKTEQKFLVFLLDDTITQQYTAISPWQNILPDVKRNDSSDIGSVPSPVQWQRGLFPIVDEVFPVPPVCVNHIMSPVLLQNDTSVLATTGGYPLVCLKTYGTGHVLWIGTDETWRWQDDDIHRRFWTEILRLFFVPSDVISDERNSEVAEHPSSSELSSTENLSQPLSRVSPEFRVLTPQTLGLVELATITGGSFITAKEFINNTQNTEHTGHIRPKEIAEFVEKVGMVALQTENGTRPVVFTMYRIGSKLFWTLLLVGLLTWQWLKTDT